MATRQRERQVARVRLARAIEEARLLGLIETRPEERLRETRPGRQERVAPESQTDQLLPTVTEEAIRRGWAVPESAKPRLVDELVAIATDTEGAARVKVQAVRALLAADRQQRQDDNPTGDRPSAQVTVNVAAVLALNAALETGAGDLLTGRARDANTVPDLGVVDALPVSDNPCPTSTPAISDNDCPVLEEIVDNGDLTSGLTSAVRQWATWPPEPTPDEQGRKRSKHGA